MKALVLREYNKLAVEEVPAPACPDDGVLVRVKACAICGSDVHGMDGSTGRRIPPLVMGHEASGVVAEAGKNAGEFRVGDRVTFDSTIYCGKCRYCRAGDVNLCDDRKVLGVAPPEFHLDGAFAELVAVPARVLYRLPDAVSFDRAAMVEPLAVAFHAVRRSGAVLGDSAVVVGTGMIGLLIVQLLRRAGCGPIIAVDLAAEKLAMAKRFGADHAVLADENALAAIAAATGGRGADRSFEVVGATATTRLALACLRKGGAATQVGNFSPEVEFPLQEVVTRQISVYGTYSSAGEYPQCLELIAAGKVDVDSFISAVAPLAEGPAWFKRLYDGEAGLLKVILRP